MLHTTPLSFYVPSILTLCVELHQRGRNLGQVTVQSFFYFKIK